MSYTTILVKLRSPLGSAINGQIIVRDGFALSTFSDPTLARKLYEKDLQDGLMVSFNETHNAYIQKFEGMSKQQIINKISKELKKGGGELVEAKAKEENE